MIYELIVACIYFLNEYKEVWFHFRLNITDTHTYRQTNIRAITHYIEHNLYLHCTLKCKGYMVVKLYRFTSIYYLYETYIHTGHLSLHTGLPTKDETAKTTNEFVFLLLTFWFPSSYKLLILSYQIN